MFKPPKENIILRTLDFLHNHIIIVSIAVIALISCLSIIILAYNGNSTSDDNSLGNSNSKYVKSNTVYLPMHRINSLNPLTSKDDDTYHITQLIYSSLFKLDSNLNIADDLADSYSTGSGKVSINLKSNVKFSDGTSLTTEDVRFTIDKIKSIGSSSPYYTYANKISSVSGSGHSLTIYFKDSNDAALDNLIFPIVSSSDYSSESGYVPMGSGQYKYSSYDKKQYLKLVPNKEYYGKVAKNDVMFKLIKYYSKAIYFVTTDALTGFISESSSAKADAKDKNLKCTQINSNEAEYLGFNFKNQVLAQKEIRHAIAYAVDTNSLIKDNYGNNATVSDTIYFPGFLGTKNNGDPYKYNQSKAIQLLKESGYTDNDEDGKLEDKNGKELTLTLLVNSNDVSRSDAASSIAASLENIGININLEKENWNSYKSKLSKGSFDLVVGGYSFDKEYNLRDLFDKGNDLNYSNSVVISGAEKLETTLTDSEQKAAYIKLKSELIDDIPYYCLCYKKFSFISVENFKTKEKPTFFNYYRGISTWEWDKTVTPDTASDTYKKNNS